jgi:cob(I)alamin adenosyltransferase
MKIYTRTGDDGTTGLFGGPRVSKNHQRIVAYGTIDELNACLGLCRAENPSEPADTTLAHIQSDLFAIGAELASPDPQTKQTATLTGDDVAHLEQRIDQFEAGLEPLRTFILPGGTREASCLHLARCVCRRAERELVTLAAQEPVRGEVLRYVNRVSDLLFVLAREANRHAGVADVPWKPRL